MDDDNDSPLTPKENKVAAAASVGLLLLVGAALAGGLPGLIAVAGGSLYAYAIGTAFTSSSEDDRPPSFNRRDDAAARDNSVQPITLQPDAPSQHWQQHVEAQAKTTTRTR